MADKTTPFILDALRRAAAEPAGLPLYAAKAAPGLFPATTAARQAAQRCLEEGHLRLVRTENRGKSPQEICALTEKGLTHLLAQSSPKHVLEDLVRALETRHAQVAELLHTARQWQADVEELKRTVGQVLQELHAPAPVSANGSHAWPAAILDGLAQWQGPDDHPLPELFRKVQRVQPSVTIGQFHDALRRFQEEGRIALHPWTGPLYDMPEPAYALLTGHEIAYYACLRT